MIFVHILQDWIELATYSEGFFFDVLWTVHRDIFA